MIDIRKVRAFQKQVWDYYAAHGRHDLPWRIPEPDGSFDAYKILVSEVMLQQTQVIRCIPIYRELLYRFPTVTALAAAPLSDVLIAWSGLGYNRRAKFLHQAAQMIVQDFGGRFPQDMQELTKLPGVGKNTAGAVLAYAFNQPVAFLETNIRTVFVHHFFKDETGVSDTAILEVVKLTFPSEGKEQLETRIHSAPRASSKTARGPQKERILFGVSCLSRDWYWALMDYGSYLKKSVGNVNKASKSYTKQSPFAGSRRQIRGQVLRLLATKPHTKAALRQAIPDERLMDVLAELGREGLIHQGGTLYRLGA